MRNYTKFIHFKIPTFPSGDRWEQFKNEYLLGEYDPHWVYKKIRKCDIKTFMEKYPLAIKT